MTERRRYAQGGGVRPIPRHRAFYGEDRDQALILVVTDCEWRVRVVDPDEPGVMRACERCGEAVVQVPWTHPPHLSRDASGTL